MRYDDGIGGIIEDDDNPDDPRNRAEYAFEALLAYEQVKHDGDDTLTSIEALITDLLHLADQHGMNFAPDFVAGALRHYEAEKAENESEA